MKPILLAFGGHDPTGGAGIQADIETAIALDTHATTVITADTLQDSHHVHSFQPTSLDLLIQQGRMVLEEFPISAIKIGMVATTEICEAIHTLLVEHPTIPVILDPVLSGGGGGELSSDQLADAIRTLLIPLTTVATPNRSELQHLAPQGDTLQACGAELISLGCDNLLITGTDTPASDEASDQVHHQLMQSSGEQTAFHYPRLPHNYHGSGCTLATAIATQLAHQTPLSEAIQQALDYSWKSIDNGFQPGSGQHFPNRTKNHG